ncbi:MAG: carotenoid 1,2-hydratase [Acidobacteria bacterium]|nr:MAG: carotenoid 1,2-hydratase [Acidobacteriota bacterium]
MRNRHRRYGAAVHLLLAVLLSAGPVTTMAASPYRVAMPGFRFEFPRDHFDHPEFQTEWWYYTGNLRARDGRRFGFELTFFRQAVSRERPEATSPWTVRDIYLAHFAVSDIDGARFHHDERVNRAGPGVAGANAEAGRIWNGNWEVQWDEGRQNLQAVADGFTIRLALESTKPPVVHGREGVSRKAAGPGRASHYVSLTRLRASGSLELGGRSHIVDGTAWMDHEFFTHQLEADQAGWDWFSLQLEDGTELMLFRLRRKDGGADPFSAGTFVDREGRSRHLEAGDFRLQPGARRWRSAETGGAYPIEWQITVESLRLTLDVGTPLERQEIVARSRVSPSYWEGAIDASGQRRGAPTRGVGYLEMTGYDKPVRFGIEK